MLCPHCAKEIPSASATCPFCAQTLLSGDPLSAGTSQSSPSQAKQFLIWLVCMVGVLLIYFMAYWKAKLWSHGNFNPEAAGYLIGSLLTPVLLAWLVVWLIGRKRNPPMPGSTKALIGVAIAFGISCFSLFGEFSSRVASNNSVKDDSVKHDVGHLLKQAAGKEAPAADVNWYDGPSRNFFSDVIKHGQEYETAINAVDNSSIKQLYSAQSYATQAGMQSTISQLQALLDVDKKYESMDPVFKKLEGYIQAANASQSEKDAFLKGIQQSAAKSMAPRAETFHAEEIWLVSSIELYQFTLSHFNEYRIQNKKLIFKNNSLVSDFQDRQSKSMALRTAAIDSRSKADTSRKNALSDLGLTPQDVPEPSLKK
jgi:hypothetical protein